MGRLVNYFRKAHKCLVSGKAAARLAQVVRNMRNVDGTLRLGITGSDPVALLPKHVDVTLGELRRVLRISHRVA
ncbi:MAG TPA: hypothetical protein VEA41_06175 [Salinarimonas sp.]|nr:hypothetical protein [Salinarimonas sp.]